MKVNKETRKQNIIKGVNKESFYSILYLLKSFVFKQPKFYILSIVFSLMFFIPFIFFRVALDNYDVLEISNMYTYYFISLIMIPVVILCLFIISNSLSKISSTTLIKRIGSTRLNEKGYISIVSVIYTMFAFSIFFITYIFWVIIFKMLGASNSAIFSGNIVTIIYILLFILLMVSTGVLIGTSGIGQSSKTTISFFLFITFFIFSDLFLVKNNIWTSVYMPTFIRYLYIFIVFSNPWIIPTLFIKGFFYDGLTFIGPIFIILGFLFVVSGTVTITLFSMANMSFTKNN